MPNIHLRNNYQKAVVCMVLAYISIALMGVFVKYASDELPSSEILFSRFFICLFIFHKMLDRRVLQFPQFILKIRVDLRADQKDPHAEIHPDHDKHDHRQTAVHIGRCKRDVEVHGKCKGKNRPGKG